MENNRNAKMKRKKVETYIILCWLLQSSDFQGEFDLYGPNPQSSIDNLMLKDSLNTNAHYAVD
jgi:hypothetical protein